MINALIVDDEDSGIRAITNLLKNYSNYTICGTARTVEEAIELTHKLQPDIVFLDIELGSKTGFDYLNMFQKIDFKIIFITAHDHAIKAFEYSALHYLLKPIDNEKFEIALLKMNDLVTQKQLQERLLSFKHTLSHPNSHNPIHLTTSENSHKLNTEIIIFLEADSNYTHLHLISSKKMTVSKTLKHFEELFPKTLFYRVHKSYLVNIEQIKTYHKKTGKIIMSNDKAIIIAKRRQKEFFEKYFN